MYIVLVKSPKYRRPLNSNQVRLLSLCFKFRFVSVPLLAEWLGRDKSSIYEGLYVLEQQGYIGKRYDKTYRLAGRPASYYLASKGIRYLRENSGLDHTTLRNFYKNKNASTELVDHCLLVNNILLTLKRQTGNKFDIFTKYELDRKIAPMAPPDLYLQSKKEDMPNYVLDIFAPGTYTWLLRKRIRQYQDYAGQDEYRIPDVLFVAQNQSTENRLFKLTYENYEEFRFLLTQQEILLNSRDGKVWIDMEEAEEDEVVRTRL